MNDYTRLAAVVAGLLVLLVAGLLASYPIEWALRALLGW